MTQYDKLIFRIQSCLDDPHFKAVKAIELLEQSVMAVEHLQRTIRDYNPNDAIFAKQPAPEDELVLVDVWDQDAWTRNDVQMPPFDSNQKKWYTR